MDNAPCASWRPLNGGRFTFIDVGGHLLEDCSKDEFFNHPENRQPRTKDFLSKILKN